MPEDWYVLPPLSFKFEIKEIITEYRNNPTISSKFVIDMQITSNKSFFLRELSSKERHQYIFFIINNYAYLNVP